MVPQDQEAVASVIQKFGLKKSCFFNHLKKKSMLLPAGDSECRNESVGFLLRFCQLLQTNKLKEQSFSRTLRQTYEQRKTRFPRINFPSFSLHMKGGGKNYNQNCCRIPDAAKSPLCLQPHMAGTLGAVVYTITWRCHSSVPPSFSRRKSFEKCNQDTHLPQLPPFSLSNVESSLSFAPEGIAENLV